MRCPDELTVSDPENRPQNSELELVLTQIRACRLCEAHLPHGPRPVLHASATARLCIVSQAPGIHVHETGLSFNDRSGDRLREWMGIGREAFYDESRIAIAATAFCFPGYDENGHDLPPRRECAATWRSQLFGALPEFPLTLLVGSYAQAWHLGPRAKGTLTGTVQAWSEYAPRTIPLPHPSWRNTGWLKNIPGSKRICCPICAGASPKRLRPDSTVFFGPWCLPPSAPLPNARPCCVSQQRVWPGATVPHATPSSSSPA
jgi:uracil-DNA glycosylase